MEAILKTFCLLKSSVFVNCVHVSMHNLSFYWAHLAAWSFIWTRLCRDVQLNSNSNMKLTCKQTNKKRKEAAEVTHFTWRKWSMSGLSDRAISSAWTYFWLGAKYWIADITRVAVGTKCCTLNLKVGILLHEKKVRKKNLCFSLSYLCKCVWLVTHGASCISSICACFTLMLRLEKCRFRE